jgi:hypothetical protein
MLRTLAMRRLLVETRGRHRLDDFVRNRRDEGRERDDSGVDEPG